MPITVQLEGKTHQFPDGTSDADIKKALESEPSGPPQGFLAKISAAVRDMSKGPFPLPMSDVKDPATKSAIDRTLSGTVGGTAGMLTGGPVGAVLGAGSMAAAPPQSPGEMAATAAGFGLGPLVSGKAEALLKNAPWLARMAARAGMGMGQVGANAGIQKAMDGDSKTDFSDWKTYAAGAGLPMLMGGVADRLNKRAIQPAQNVTGYLQDNVGGPQPPRPNQASANAVAHDVHQNLQSSLADLQQQFQTRQTAAQQGIQEVSNKMNALTEQIHAVALTGADQTLKGKAQIAAINSQIRDLAKQRDTFATTLGQTQDGQQLSQKVLATNHDYLDAQAQKQLDLATLRKARIQRDQNPNTGDTLSAPHDQDTKNILIDNQETQAQGIKKDVQGRKQQLAKKVAQDLQDPDSALNRAQLAYAQVQVTDATGQKQAIQDQQSVNKASLGVQKFSLLSEQQKQQKIYDDLKAGLKDTSNPMLLQLTGAGEGQLPSATAFMDKVMAAPPEHITALYGELAGQEGGLDKIKTIKDAVVGRTFQKAYDKGGFDEIAKSMNSDGPLSYDKRVALFGGGPEGKEQADKFADVMSDLKKLVAPPPPTQSGSAVSRYAPVTASIAGASLLLHTTGSFSAGTMGEAGLVGAAAGASVKGIGYIARKVPDFVDGLLDNPKMFDAFHKWVQGGATSTALMLQPQLQRFLRDTPDTTK